jgi:hypothetical protein
MIGSLMVQNVDQSLNIDQDHKTYGTWDDFMDGWLHYILLLIQLEYPDNIIQDRIITLRWMMEGEYQPKSRLDFMYRLRSQFPDTNLEWYPLANTQAMLMVTYLKPFDSSSKGHTRGATDSPGRDRPNKKQKTKKDPKKPKRNDSTATMKAAQTAVFKSLQNSSTTKLRLCYSSSSDKPCSKTPCSFTHVCLKCAGEHAKTDCPLP